MDSICGRVNPKFGLDFGVARIPVCLRLIIKRVDKINQTTGVGENVQWLELLQEYAISPIWCDIWILSESSSFDSLPLPGARPHRSRRRSPLFGATITSSYSLGLTVIFKSTLRYHRAAPGLLSRLSRMRVMLLICGTPSPLRPKDARNLGNTHIFPHPSDCHASQAAKMCCIAFKLPWRLEMLSNGAPFISC